MINIYPCCLKNTLETLCCHPISEWCFPCVGNNFGPNILARRSQQCFPVLKTMPDSWYSCHVSPPVSCHVHLSPPVSCHVHVSTPVSCHVHVSPPVCHVHVSPPVSCLVHVPRPVSCLVHVSPPVSWSIRYKLFAVAPSTQSTHKLDHLTSHIAENTFLLVRISVAEPELPPVDKLTKFGNWIEIKFFFIQFCYF